MSPRAKLTNGLRKMLRALVELQGSESFSTREFGRNELVTNLLSSARKTAEQLQGFEA